jgi:Rrf2 family protein
MMFSKSCEYAIKAVIYISNQSESGIRVSLHDISEKINSPVAFTAKILQKLSKANIINSNKGPSGGFKIEQSNLTTINLAKIVKCIDGDGIYEECGLGFGKCSDSNPCPVHFKFIEIRQNLKNMLENTSLKELSDDLSNGITFLK